MTGGEPLGYLVVERRGGDLCLGDDWTEHTDDRAQALATAERWRAGGTYDAVVVALVEVPEMQAQAPDDDLPTEVGAMIAEWFGRSPIDADVDLAVQIIGRVRDADPGRGSGSAWNLD